VDPRSGYVARNPFLTIAGVNEWLDKLAGPELAQLRQEQQIAKQLEERKWTAPSPEDRERSLKMWEKVRGELGKKQRRQAAASSSILTPEEQARLDRMIADPDFPELKGAKQIGEIL